jgi:hypothetical protein
MFRRQTTDLYRSNSLQHHWYVVDFSKVRYEHVARVRVFGPPAVWTRPHANYLHLFGLLMELLAGHRFATNGDVRHADLTSSLFATRVPTNITADDIHQGRSCRHEQRHHALPRIMASSSSHLNMWSSITFVFPIVWNRKVQFWSWPRQVSCKCIQHSPSSYMVQNVVCRATYISTIRLKDATDRQTDRH